MARRIHEIWLKLDDAQTAVIMCEQEIKFYARLDKNLAKKGYELASDRLYSEIYGKIEELKKMLEMCDYIHKSEAQ